jgi:restriction system protein
MEYLPEEELRRVRGSFERKLRELELEIEDLTGKALILREQIQAIDTLVQPNEQAANETMYKTQAGTSSRPTADSWGEFTPTEAYWIPILEALAERGGREHSDVVLEIVEKKMTSILTEKDYEILPSGISVRWRNRAQWQRQNMVQQGLLSNHSPRGIWEITPPGRQWLHEHKREAS